MNNKKLGIKHIIIVIAFLNVINIGIMILPMADYYIYNANSDKYMVVNATVIDKKEKTIIYGKPRPLVDIAETRIKFDINGKTNYKNMYTYPECEISEKIMVAVSENNVRRCIIYQFTSSDIGDVMVYILVTVICMAVYYILSKVEMANNEIIEREKQYSIDDFDVENYLLIENKKKKIIELTNARSKSAVENLVNISELERELACIVNEHFVWCLGKFTGSKVGNLMFPFASKDKEFNFVEVTRKLHSQGLHEDYYVISEKNNIIWCCCAHEDRVFSYSKGLGITKTKYFDIFDFIIDNWEKEREEHNLITE